MVYVDDADVSKYGRGWFHLTADSINELHTFAARIGLPARFFHWGARHPHYDITAVQRKIALRSGARPVSSREIVRISKQISVSPSVLASWTRDAQLVLFA